jgi:hypothetical protein
VAVAVGALVLGGTGLAGASAGAAFLLARANRETSEAGLSDTRGTPLSLSAPVNKAPLTVNRNVMVRNLNAQYLDGLSAASLVTTGGGGFQPDGYVAPTGYTLVADTGALAAGVYYVTATAYLNLTGTGSTGTTCIIVRNGAYSQPLQSSSADSVSGGSLVQTAQTTVVYAQHKDDLQEWCAPTGGANQNSPIVDSAGITAIRIAYASSGS